MTDGHPEDLNIWFHEPTKPVNLMNPIVLAYIGDAVYEVFVRQYLISLPNHKPHHLHRQATQFVSAKAQCLILEKWRPHSDGRGSGHRAAGTQREVRHRAEKCGSRPL